MCGDSTYLEAKEARHFQRIHIDEFDDEGEESDDVRVGRRNQRAGSARRVAGRRHSRSLHAAPVAVAVRTVDTPDHRETSKTRSSDLYASPSGARSL